MGENRVSEKEYQNRRTPQVTMSDLSSSQFICSEIMTMHKTRFYTKIRWGVILLGFVLFSCIIELTLLFSMQRQQAHREMLKQLQAILHVYKCHFFCSVDLFFMRKDQSNQNYLSLLPWSYLVPAKIFSLNTMRHVCPQAIFPRPQQKLGGKLPSAQ